jgi:hypothetical protein
MLHTDLISCAWYHAPAAQSEKPRSASAACRARPVTGDVKVVKAHEPYHLQISTVNPEDSLKIHKDSKKTCNLYQKIVVTICLLMCSFWVTFWGFCLRKLGMQL